MSQIIISESELLDNYKYWLSKWNPCLSPDKSLIELINSFFPTHTFGYIKTVNGIPTYPYKKIFGVDQQAQGILSDGFREDNGLYADSELRRTMNSTRSIGLNYYVFAYLSIHDPYYGRPSKEEVDLNPRPFGIFIKKDIETLPKCLPSRRDLNVHRMSENNKLRRELIHPNDARSLLSYQIANDNEHPNDFWYYYGTPWYYKNEEYSTAAWKRRIEYHYFSKLELADIEAVLWPIWYRNARKPGVMEWDASYYAIPKIMTKFPTITVIPYEWDDSDPEMSFLEASYLAVKYKLKYKNFPLSIDIAKTETYG